MRKWVLPDRCDALNHRLRVKKDNCCLEFGKNYSELVGHNYNDFFSVRIYLSFLPSDKFLTKGK